MTNEKELEAEIDRLKQEIDRLNTIINEQKTQLVYVRVVCRDIITALTV